MTPITRGCDALLRSRRDRGISAPFCVLKWLESSNSVGPLGASYALLNLFTLLCSECFLSRRALVRDGNWGLPWTWKHWFLCPSTRYNLSVAYRRLDRRFRFLSRFWALRLACGALSGGFGGSMGNQGLRTVVRMLGLLTEGSCGPGIVG